MRKRGMLGLALATLAVAAGAAPEPEIKFYGSPTERKQVEKLHGKVAPELAGLKWVQGGPQTLAKLRGKVVLLEFWAQW